MRKMTYSLLFRIDYTLSYTIDYYIDCIYLEEKQKIGKE